MLKNKIIKFLLKLAVSVGLISWLVLVTDWKEVGRLMLGMDYFYLALYVVFLVLGIAISSYKWQKLAAYKNIKKSFGDFFRFYLAGIFINNFMPSFIGGDTFKAYQIGKEGKRYSEAASSVIADRITGLVGILLLALTFATLNYSVFMSNEILSFVYVLILIGFHLFIFYLIFRRFSFWEKVSARLPKKVSKFVSVLNSYADRSILRKAIFYSVVFSLIGVAFSNFFLFQAFGAEISLKDYFSVIFLISIVSSVPISINNIGVKEWAYVTFFGIFGVSSPLVVAVAILSRVIQMIVSFFALPVYLRATRNERLPK